MLPVLVLLPFDLLASFGKIVSAIGDYSGKINKGSIEIEIGLGLTHRCGFSAFTSSVL
jgi:hypothetical protein